MTHHHRTRTRRWAGLLVGLSLTATAAACAGEDGQVVTKEAGTVGGVGSLPEALSISGRYSSTTEVPTTPRPTIAMRGDFDELVAAVEGNRLLMIGDSIFASTSRRYGGQMCFVLLPLGWAVEVNAEPARFVEFGARVLDRRLRPESGVDWDVAVVHLGSNFRGDVEAYRRELFAILDRLAPRPTVLVTVSEFRPDRARVNEVVRDMVRFYSNVVVLDWADITAREPGLTGGDRLHLTDDGRARLALEIAELVGPAPEGSTAACLSSSFTDDSATNGPGAVSPPVTGPVTTSARPRPTPLPTTTGGGTGGAGGGSGGGTGGGSGAAPTTTSAPATVPTTTGAPTETEPTVPATSVPDTSAPTTAAPPPVDPTPPPTAAPTTQPAPTSTAPPSEGG